MIMPRPTFRWCLRISISAQMFVYFLHNFSLEPFLYYLAFSLTYDILDHRLFKGPDAWYMTRDSLISLIWILTLHLGDGEFLYTIYALMATSSIWVFTAALKVMASTRRMERGQRERELMRKEADLLSSLNQKKKLKQFEEMYEVDPKRAAKEFPFQFSKYREEKSDAEVEQMGEEWRDNAWERVSREAVDRRGAVRSRENDDAIKYVNTAFGGRRAAYSDKEAKQKKEIHKSTSNGKSKEEVKYGKPAFGGGVKKEKNREMHKDTSNEKSKEAVKYGDAAFGGGQATEKTKEKHKNIPNKKNREAAKYGPAAFGGGIQKHEQIHGNAGYNYTDEAVKGGNAWHSYTDEAVKDGNAPKSKIEEIECILEDEEVGNWVP